MKQFKEIIQEKLKITSKTKIKFSKYLLPEEIDGPITPGKDYYDEDITIIGWPFKDKNDLNYQKTIKYINQNHYKIWNNLDDIEYKERYEYFVYAGKLDNIAPNILDCWVYGDEGVIGIRKK